MAFDLTALLGFAHDEGASDLHVSAGLPPMLRIRGEMVRLEMPALSRDDAHMAIYDILQDDQKRDCVFVANHNAYAEQKVALKVARELKTQIFNRSEGRWQALELKEGIVRFALAAGGGELLRFEK